MQATEGRAQGRLELLLDVMNRVIPHLALREVLRETARSIRRVMECDGAVIALHNAESDELCAYALDFPESRGFAKEGNSASATGASDFAQVFRTGQPGILSISESSKEGCPADVKFQEGISTACVVPLATSNRVLGVMGLGRRRDAAFEREDVEFVVQLGRQVAVAVENALEYGRVSDLNDRLEQEKLYLQDELRSELNFGEIVGQSAALRRALRQVEMVAPTDSTVLICGETGTGKELIARAVHNLSDRRDHPFVKLNCAAIPTGLLESELFGHEKGAFTGAINQRIGRFELASTGSVFLDEIGEIPLELQPKLLRVLQEREFERLGSARTLKTGARLIAATNCDLAGMVRQGRFRADLFYRLNVFPIEVPPLRDRTEDIPLLVRHFAQQFSRRMRKNIESIASTTMSALVAYEWPGNIRELQNVVERAVILTEGTALTVPASSLGDHQAPATNNPAKPNNIQGVLETVERDEILGALRATNWIVAGARGAAARLGMKRSTLQLRMQKLGISRSPE
jgi:formate hydrogenlyase transcriptional activator